MQKKYHEYMKFNSIRIKSIFTCALAAGTILASCSGEKKQQQEADTDNETVKVETAMSDFRPVEQINTFTATVEADVTNNIAPQSAMRIKKVFAEVGDHVRAGQKLAEMDAVNLDQTRLQMENDKIEFTRADELYKIGGTSKSDWEAKKLKYDLSKRSYENLKENTTLVSPTSGIVTKRNYDSGDMYSATEPLYVVEKITPVKLLINVSESLYTKVRKGMEVDVKLDVYGDELFKAKMNIIYPTIDPETRTFPIELVIANANERVRPGMFARATICYDIADRVVIPDRAVQKLTGSGDRYVFVAIDGKAVYRKVELGRRLDSEYEILSGVNKGETVIITGQSRLKDGSPIEITNNSSNQPATADK